MGELVFLSVLAVIAIVMFALTFTFPTSIIDKSGGAAMFPRIIIVLLLFFMLIRIIMILKTKKEDRKPFVFLEIFKGSKLIYLVATFVYFLIIKPVGFIISSSVYLIAAILFFGYLQKGTKPNKKVIAIVAVSSIVGVVLLDLLFCRVLGVMLPVGILGF